MASNLKGTTVLSGLSLLDGLSTSTLSLLNGLSANTITAASTLSVGGAATLSTSVAVGSGTAISKILAGTVSIVTMTVTGAASLSTTATISGLSTVDIIHVSPPSSGLSGDLTIDAWASAANTVTVKFSTTSSAGAVQAGPVNYNYVAFRV